MPKGSAESGSGFGWVGRGLAARGGGGDECRGEPKTDERACASLLLAASAGGAFLGDGALGGYDVPGSDALCDCSSFDLGAPAEAGRGVGRIHSPSANARTSPLSALPLFCSREPGGGAVV